jgi:gliding motility-associated-like protein
MNRKIFLFLILILTFASCRKEDELPTPPPFPSQIIIKIPDSLTYDGSYSYYYHKDIFYPTKIVLSAKRSDAVRYDWFINGAYLNPDSDTLSTIIISEGESIEIRVDIVLQNNTILNYRIWIPYHYPDVYIANSFTPDEDCINDMWYIKYNGVYFISVEVFNNYSQLVFSEKAGEDTGNPFLKGWNGTYKNKGKKLLPAGKYFYRIRYVLVNGEKATKTGYVEMVY